MPDFERIFDKLAVDIQPNDVEKQKMLAFQDGKNFARWQIVKVVGIFLLGYVLLSLCGCNRYEIDNDGKSVNMDKSSNFMYTEWNGHRYIVNTTAYSGGITHDPDCPNCLKRGKFLP